MGKQKNKYIKYKSFEKVWKLIYNEAKHLQT